jgi:fatty-acyl-CoA synthase
MTRWDDLLHSGKRVSAALVDERAATVDHDSAAIIKFTSGSTGKPKGVLLSHVGVRLAVEKAAVLGMTCNDVQLNYLPLFHSYSLSWALLNCAVSGAHHVLMNRFNAEEALDLIGQERVTMLHGFEAHYGEMLALYEANRGKYNVGTLRVGTHNVGSESGRAMIRRFQSTFCRTMTPYGLTETWGGVTCDHPKDLSIDDSADSAGYPLPGVEIKIVGPDTNKELPPENTGEILVKSYCTMLGYYKNPVETDKALDNEGWLHTGDAGYLRTDGRLHFVGRYKDMIRVGGENVDPTEIESLLVGVEGVAQVAVVACPDERLSEVVAAFVIRAPGAESAELRAAIDSVCRGRVASFKAPKRIEFIDAFPMTGTGKIDRRALRQLL